MASARWGGWRQAWPAAALALVYLWTFPFFGAMKSAAELPRVILAEELLGAGRLDLDGRLGELGSRFDVATTPEGRHYSNKAPGLSLLGAPVAALHGAIAGAPSIRAATRVLRLAVVTLPCLAFLLGFAALARRFAGDDEGARRRGVIAYALGCMALPYGLLYFAHAPAAAAIGIAFVGAVALARGPTARPRALALGVGLAAGVAVLIEYQALLGALAVGGYLLAMVRRRDRPAGAARPAPTIGLALLGASPPLLGLVAYHQAAFGAPWRTGYAFAADPAHRQGVLGIVGPNREAMWNALLAPSNGLLALTPWVLVAIVGAIAIARDRDARARIGPEALVAGGIALAYVVFVGSLVPAFGRGGWSVGPRYAAIALPFLAWLACAGYAALASRPILAVVADGLLVAGVAIHVVAATTFPHWPDGFRNPLHEVSLRALGEGLAPHALGEAVGLAGVVGLVPAYAAVAALLAWALGAGGGRAARVVVAAALGLGLVAAAAGLPSTRAAERERMWRYVRSVWEPTADGVVHPPR
jgi:hypothetical protein